MSMHDVVLDVRNLSLKTGEIKILDNVTFSVNKGSLTAVCGNNGAGKTSLLMILKGLIRQSEGSIFIDNTDVSQRRGKRLEKTGLAFQEPELQIVGETVEKDLMFGLKNLRLDDSEIKKRTSEILDILDLEKLKNRAPSTLSGGEKRRLVLGGVLIMKPQIIMLDEMLSNLDFPTSCEMLRLLMKLKETGQTIILVSHDVEKYLKLTDRVIILENGKTVFTGCSELSLPLLKKHRICASSLEFDKMTLI